MCLYMTKLALLKQVSFSTTGDQISLYLSDKVLFHEFNGTIDLFHKIHEFLGNNMIEVQNCSYDEKYLIQAFFIEDNSCSVHDNIIMVKRLINDDDSYTYLTATADKLEQNEMFTYLDVSYEDIEVVLRRKTELKCVIVKTNGDVNNVMCSISHNNDTQIGTLSVKTESGNKKTFNYLDIPLICNKESESGKTSEQIDEIITKKTEELNVDFFYSQYHFSMGLLNCYSPIFGKEKNNVMSELLGMDFYGDILISLENNLNEDERLLDLDSAIFNKIKKIFNKTNFENKNKLFCNIYYELANM